MGKGARGGAEGISLCLDKQQGGTPHMMLSVSLEVQREHSDSALLLILHRLHEDRVSAEDTHP